MRERLSKGTNVHTLVLWTKHPRSLLAEPLFSFLEELKRDGVQLFLQLTITGMGGLKVGERCDGKPLILEPNVPDRENSVAVLPEVVKLLGNAERLRLRIDPIVRVGDAVGNVFSNLRFFEPIVKVASDVGIKNFSFSFLEDNIHKKVNTRFERLGCSILSPDEVERERSKVWIAKLAEKYGVVISACCVAGFPKSRCIDGEVLSKLHDAGYSANCALAKKRELCGCSKSIDIGGWPPKKCFSGCDYCYARSEYK